MHNTEYPVTTFAILDSHTCVTSDNILDLLMIKMKPLYESRKNLNIECKGTRFEYNDFLMKTATVQSVTTKSDIGVLLEVMSLILGSLTLILLYQFMKTFVTFLYCRLSTCRRSSPATVTHC